MWEIYSIGDAAYLTAVFNAVAMIFGGQDIKTLAAIGFMVGAVFAVIKGIMSGGKEVDFQSLVVGLVIYMCLFAPKTTVTIESVYTGSVRQVANVPLGPAFLGSMISQIGLGITNLMETAFAYPSMTTYGFGDSLNTLAKMRQAASNSTFVKQVGGPTRASDSLENYINNCTLVGIDLGQLSASEIETAENIGPALRWDSDIYTTAIWKNAYEEEPMTCTDAWTPIFEIVKSAGVLDENINNALKGKIANDNEQRKDGSTIDVQARMNNIATNMANAGAYAQKMALGSVIQTISNSAVAQHYWDDMLTLRAAEISTVNRSRNAAWQLEGDAFARVAIPLMTFFEGLIFALAPFMVFLLGTGRNGIMLIGKYLQIGLWVQLWMPMLALVNLYLNMAFYGSLESFSETGGAPFPSMQALDHLDSELHTWLGVASKLVASVPAISLMLLYGGAQAATHMAKAFDSSATAATAATSMSAPTALRNGPAIANASAYNATAIGGTMASGAESIQTKYSMGSMASSAVNSSENYMRSATETLGAQAASAISSSTGSGASGRLAASVSDNYGRDFKSSQKMAMEQSQALQKKYGLTDAQTKEVNRQINAGIQGGFKIPDILPLSGGVSTSASQGMGIKNVQQLSNAINNDIGDMFKEGTEARNGFERSFGSDIANSKEVSSTIQDGKSENSTLNSSLQSQTSASQTYNRALAQQETFKGDSTFAANEVGKRINDAGGLPALSQMIHSKGLGRSVARAEEGLRGEIADPGARYAAAAVGVMSGQFGLTGGESLGSGAESLATKQDAMGIIANAFNRNTPQTGNASQNSYLQSVTPTEEQRKEVVDKAKAGVPSDTDSAATVARLNAGMAATPPPNNRAGVHQHNKIGQTIVDNEDAEHNKPAYNAARDPEAEKMQKMQSNSAKDILSKGALQAEEFLGEKGKRFNDPSGNVPQEKVDQYLEEVNSGVTNNVSSNSAGIREELRNSGLTPAQTELAVLQGHNLNRREEKGASGRLQEQFDVAREAVRQEAGGGEQGDAAVAISTAAGYMYSRYESGSNDLTTPTGSTGIQALAQFNEFNENK